MRKTPGVCLAVLLLLAAAGMPPARAQQANVRPAHSRRARHRSQERDQRIDGRGGCRREDRRSGREDRPVARRSRGRRHRPVCRARAHRHPRARVLRDGEYLPEQRPRRRPAGRTRSPRRRDDARGRRRGWLAQLRSVQDEHHRSVPHARPLLHQHRRRRHEGRAVRAGSRRHEREPDGDADPRAPRCDRRRQDGPLPGPGVGSGGPRRRGGQAGGRACDGGLRRRSGQSGRSRISC